MIADISQLPPTALTERGITAHIASRFHQGMPYSSVSSRTLVAVNTFADELDLNQEQVFRDMATRVFNRMVTRNESQACVFLGESGSGKSEYAASLMRSMLTLAGNPLSTRCRSVQPVLDAFSTAKTANSLGSSKVGLIRELQFDEESNFIGLAVYDYRLERQRVTKVGTNERNYHVFYYMINGLSNAERQYLHLANQEFRYLGHRSQLHVNGIDDKMKFKQLKLALYSLSFSRADVANIFQILAAILHLGQLEFRRITPDISQAVSAVVEITNREILEKIAQLLGVMPDVLHNSIVTKTGLISKDRVTIVLDQKDARDRADSLARTLYTMLFTFIMDRINENLSVHQDSPDISSVISLTDFPGFQPLQTTSSAAARQLPHLDRLLHNCANEMLYNYLVHVYFRAPEEVLETEEVYVNGSEYFDNAETVKILAKPQTGILSVIDEYARKDKDELSLRDSLKRRFQHSPSVNVEDNKFIVNHYGGEATYSIEALLENSRETLSSDFISLFANSSHNNFLRRVFESSAVADATVDNTVVKAHLANEPRRQMSVRKASVSSRVASSDEKYGMENANEPVSLGRSNSLKRSGSVKVDKRPIRRTSNPLQQRGRKSETEERSSGASGITTYIEHLDEAIDNMESEHAYFVLCLKPNDNHIMSSLDARCVRQQVSALGIPELATRAKNTDLSIFIPVNEFLRRFNGGTEHPLPNESERDCAIRLLKTERWNSRDAAVGLTGVFLSENAWIYLVDPEHLFVREAAAKFSNEGSDMHDTHVYNDLETKSLAGGFGNMFSYIPKNPGDDLAVSSDIPPDEDYTAPPKVSRERRDWMRIVWMYTFWYPTAFIKGASASVKLAWREKFAINIIIWSICASSVIILIGMPYFICPIQNVMSMGQLAEYSSDNDADKVYASIRGTIYDISKFVNSHYPSIVPREEVLDYGGSEIGDIFPIPVSAVCSLVESEKVVIGTPNNYTDDNAQYHDFRGIHKDYRPDWYLQQMAYFNKHYLKSFLGYTPKTVKQLVQNDSKSLVSLDGYVYDFTDYTSGNIFDMSNSSNSTQTQFLDSDFVDLVQENIGSDITKKFKKMNYNPSYGFELNRCIRNLFMIGKLDTQESAKCLFARYFLLGITAFVVLIIVIKFLAALQFGGYEYPDGLDKFVICQVPVYTEDEESLRRAMDSLTRTKYDDKRKLLVVICDGMIVGAGNEKPTPRIVLDILGHPEDVDPPALSMESLGEGDEQHNYGKIYTGLYEIGGHIVPYMVVVKVGKSSETYRPGNRGKRDSQMLLMRFLNRVHYNSPMSPLELEMYHQIQNVIGVSPNYYSYLMQVDADTVVSPESLSQLMGRMVRDTKIQAVCGETELSNSRESLITMIQVYEYYISHNLAKAFESLFGTVTCLPGCFTLYRLYEEETSRPLLISNPVIDGYSVSKVRTLHSKNLLQLGEDRYLTTLLLKFNPRHRTKFLRHAHAYTVAPDSWSVLLSQRRRWINSTIHNMIELVPMNQMCGFCCFSMRFMVLVDLFSTVIQPVTLGYIAYLIYLCTTRTDTIPWSSLVLIGAVYGLQIVIFVIRMKWDMIGWMFIYILALPIHSFMLPLYSFWFMDDFSWGNTRMVVGEKGKAVLVNDEKEFDPSVIPLKRWTDYEDENWRHDYGAGLPITNHSRRPSDLSLAPTVPFDSRTINEGPFRDDARESVISSMHKFAEPSDLCDISDFELTDAIRNILASSDLTKVTKRSVRAQLEAKYGASFEHRKTYISWAIEHILSGEL